MLEEVDALPGAKRQLAALDGNRKLRLGERGAYVGGHVVGAFDGVAIEAVVLRHQPVEEAGQIVDHVRIGVLLYGERSRRVLHEDREQARRD